MVFNEAVADFLPAEDGHGHASTWVDGAPGEEEVGVFFGLFGCFEGAVGFPIRGDSIDRSLIGEIHLFDIDWSEHVFDDGVFAEVGEAHSFEFGEDAIAECEVVFVGVWVVGVEGGDVGKDFDVVAAVGSFGGVGTSGGDEVDGGVVGELLFLEDGVEVFVLVLGVEEVVVGELWVDSVGAEVDDESRAGGFEFFEFAEELG